MQPQESLLDLRENHDDVQQTQKDLLWGLYQEFRIHARHAETLRSGATNYMLAVSGALIGVITFDRQIDRFDLPLALLVSLVGLTTALFSASYIELFFRNRNRGEQFLSHLDATYFKGRASATLIQLRKEADDAHQKTIIYRWGRRVFGSTHLFWLAVPLAVFAMGIGLAVIAWIK